MNRRLPLFAVILVLCPVCSLAQDYYVGPRGSMLWHHEPNTGYPIDAGLLGGASIFNTRIGRFFVESDVAANLRSGQGTRPDGEWQAHWWRVFGAYRSLGDYFLKGKIGVAVIWSRTSTYWGEGDKVGFGGAGGIGVGWRFVPRATVEIELEPFAQLRWRAPKSARVDVLAIQLVYWFGAS